MMSLAGAVAWGYARGLLPGRLASPVFWRLARRGNGVTTEVVAANVRLGRRMLRLTLHLRSVGNWTLLFSATERSGDAAMLREFDRLIQSASCVIDVGANVGLYTYYAAANAPACCKVIGVEANPDLAAAVNDNLQANALNAEVALAAVTDRIGDVRLHVGERDLVSSLDPEHVDAYGGTSRVIVVPGITLDALVDAYGVRPDVIKIDVEGHEVAALRGAENTLRDARPTLLIEVTRANAPIVHTMLAELGYHGRRFTSTGLEPIGSVIVPEDRPLGNLLYEPVN